MSRIRMALLMCLASTFGLVLTLTSHSQAIHVSSPGRFDALQELREMEFAACKHHPHRFPACRPWRQRLRDLSYNPVRSYMDTEYTMTIYYGNPPEPFEVVIDTGSRALFLTAPECASDGCDTRPEVKRRRKRFNYKGSSSFHSNFTSFNLTYGTGEVTGFIGVDTLLLGMAKVIAQDVVLATRLSPFFVNVSADGILGLNVPRDENKTAPLSVLESMVPGMTMFTIFLRRNLQPVTREGGDITFDAYDEFHCLVPQAKNWIALSKLNDTEGRNGHNFWTFQLQNFIYEGGAHGEEEDWLAASDSGSSIIRGPYDAIEAFRKRNKAEYDDDTHSYRAKCDVQFLAMTFIINGTSFTIEPEQFVMKIRGKPDCYLLIDVNDEQTGQPDWIFGQPFLRSYCNIYHIKEKKIAFMSHAI